MKLTIKMLALIANTMEKEMTKSVAWIDRKNAIWTSN